MQFNIFSELLYDVFSPTTFIFNIHAAGLSNQSILEESLLITPALPYEEFTLHNEDSRFIRLETKEETSFKITYQAIVDVHHTLIYEEDLPPASLIMELPTEVLPYLFASRHCQSDKLRKLATKKFGHLQSDYKKVTAISDWVFDNTDYITGTTDSGTSAYDTLIQREGVCKDFAHLGIALCRALDIPARYFTGYAYNLNPPDFHACFEAYIGGHWVFFDPTRLVPINGLVKIAHGRDAGDAAVASFFGNTNCTFMNVQCNPVDPDFEFFTTLSGNGAALAYE